ncbi:MAG: hypothetical protein QHH09_02180 [Microgenomates group bacterium]|nr:hypothetical protein [Microgenomates group bacterium]
MENVTFYPGNYFHISKKWYKKTSKHCRLVKVKAPARLHFSVFNFLAMKPPQPGGGGIGISVSMKNSEVIIRYADKFDHEKESSVPATAKHLRLLFCQLTNNDPKKIQITHCRSNSLLHTGLGSNVSFNTAVFYGLNELFYRPFNKQEIFDILTHNYVENDESNHLKIFMEPDTGIGEASILFGGFVLTDTKGKYTGNIEAPDIYVLVAIANKEKFILADGYSNKNSAQKSETLCLETAEKYVKKFQAKYGKKLESYLENILIPIFLKKNKKKLYSNLWNLHENGITEFLRWTYGATIINKFLKIAKENNAIYAGMSSAGPSMFVIVKNRQLALTVKKKIVAQIGDYFKDYYISEAGKKIIAQSFS